MIGFITDSGSMIPAELRHRFNVIVVPMTVTIDGAEHHEGLDLADADFYSRLAAGAAVSTSAPAPGAFVAAYRQAQDEGADQVLSILTGSNYSATVSAAAIAGDLVDIDVELVDTGLASFPVTLCLWAAGDEIEAGNSAAAAAAAARATALRTGSVFVVAVPELARRGGRFVSVDGALTPTSILELDRDGMRQLDRVDDLDAAVDAMANHVRTLAGRTALRVGIGDAMRPDVARVLVERLDGSPGIDNVVRYQVGPSVGAHTGAGTVGIVYAPLAG